MAVSVFRHRLTGACLDVLPEEFGGLPTVLLSRRTPSKQPNGSDKKGVFAASKMRPDVNSGFNDSGGKR